MDSINQKIGEGDIFFEKCAGKNLSFGGFNDVFLSISYYNHSYYRVFDSTYLRVVNGKDIYEYIDTTEFFYKLKDFSKHSINKITQNYAWMARILLSKGDKAEYVIFPQKFYTVQVDTNVYFNVSYEIKAKNEGFETVTVPAGTFNAYKVKYTITFGVYMAGQKLDAFDLIQYIWISDDLDWWIKQEQFTKITPWGIFPGEVKELISYQ